VSRAAASIPDHLFTHPAFRALDVTERWLILELNTRKGRIDKITRAKGKTPDDILGCSIREAANLLGVSKSGAGRAMATLLEKGFIAEAREPSKGQSRRGTSTGWRLTWLPFQGEPATFDYLKIADRVVRQSDAERVAGQAFFVPGMAGYEPPDDDEVSDGPDSLTSEVSHGWDAFDLGSVPRVGQVSTIDPLFSAQRNQ
jgi:hypothetical protein